jgi:hypothetical protein
VLDSGSALIRSMISLIAAVLSSPMVSARQACADCAMVRSNRAISNSSLLLKCW